MPVSAVIIICPAGIVKAEGKEPPEIKGSGYVVESLEAALWAFHNSSTFEEGCLLAVNFGDNADMTGAVYGQLAGAYYGVEEIPEDWRNTIAMREEILVFADDLYTSSKNLTGSRA